MALDNIKVNNNQIAIVDNEPIIDSENLIKSKSVAEIGIKSDYSLADLEITDEDDHTLFGIHKGDIRTKNFDSKNSIV